MSEGWVKILRRLKDHPRFRDPEWLAVWVYLLLNATHQPYSVNFDGRIVELKPGQLVSGRLTIAEKTGVHESKVKRILNLMKTDQQIDQQAGVKGSIITVRNWQTYQGTDQQNDQRVTSDRPASDQRLTTNKKNKNIRTKEQKNGERPPRRPEAWQIEKDVERISEERMAILARMGLTELAWEEEAKLLTTMQASETEEAAQYLKLWRREKELKAQLPDALAGDNS